MADAKTINGYNVKDAAAREAIANLDTVKLASSGGASGSIKFGVDSDGNYGYYKAGANDVIPFGGEIKTTTLTAGNTTATVQFTHAINSNTLVTPICSIYDVSPTSVVCESNRVTLTFEAQNQNMIVGAKIENT